jgi:2-methylcitrate dehydratase PrpD
MLPGDPWSIEAVGLLLEEHGIKIGDILSIKVAVPRVAYDLVGHQFDPGENPIIAAQFSIQYTVAARVLYGKLTLEEFNPQKISDPRIKDVVKRISMEVGEFSGSGGFVPIEVEIVTTNGMRYFKKIEVLKGHPDNPIDDAEIVEKFRNCANFGGIKISERDLDRLVEIFMNLETVRCISEITKHFSVSVKIDNSMEENQ